MRALWRITVAAVFLAALAWDTWEAIGNALGLPAFYVALGIADRLPWVLLGLGVVLPALGAGVGLWLARKRSLAGALLVYLVVLASVSALSLSLLAAKQAWRAHVQTLLMG
jgi:hypothetical protein